MKKYIIFILAAITLSIAKAEINYMDDTIEPLEWENGLYFRRLYPGSHEILIVDPAADHLVEVTSMYSGTFEVPEQIIDSDGTPLIPVALWEAIGTYNNFTLVKTPSTVRAVESFNFNGSTINSLEFSEGLNIIGDHSFCEVAGLISLDFPDTLYKIGEKSFCGLNVQTINFGKGLRLIGKESFCSNSGIEELTLPGYLNYIWEGSF